MRAMNIPKHFSLLIAVVLLGASPRLAAQPFSHEVRAATIDAPGLDTPTGMVWIQAVGFGKKETIAQRDAEVAAMSALLFQGIASTQFSMPMVANEAASRAQHQAFYDGFFEKDGYRTFISKTQLVSGLAKFKGGRKLTTRVLVDVNGLRRHLESNGVIPKFGM